MLILLEAGGVFVRVCVCASMLTLLHACLSLEKVCVCVCMCARENTCVFKVVYRRDCVVYPVCDKCNELIG